MEKKKALLIQLAVIAVFLLLIGSYLAVGFYYQNGFSFGTYINGVYCTGKSVEEVNEELKNLYDKECIFVLDEYNQVYKISLEEISFGVDYASQLESMLNSQSPFAWGANLFRFKQNNLQPQVTFDFQKLRTALENCGIAEAYAKDNSVTITKTEEGYVLYDGMLNVLDMDLVYKLVSDSLEQNITEVSIVNCFSDLPYTAKMQETLVLWEKINEFQTCGIVYDMGDAMVELSPGIVCEWISLDEKGEFLFDENGNLVFREEGVEEFISGLCLTYDTYQSTRTFQTTEGRTVTIEGGTYGNKLDAKAEIAYLKEAFVNGVSEVHIPTYEIEAFYRGKDDIGDTYIEVDMTEQMLYYYESGELLLQCSIVTGNMRRGWDTPEGVNFVYNKQTDRILRGPGYASPVDYWMPVVKSVGIHDADWRTTFGADIYKTDGSHGCINVPPNHMSLLYDMVEIGTPVVMFY